MLAHSRDDHYVRQDLTGLVSLDLGIGSGIVALAPEGGGAAQAPLPDRLVKLVVR